MLGEMISESKGKITACRVLPSEGQGPRFEITFQGNGKLLGVETTDMGTYESVLTAAGTYHGKGQGVITTRDGDLISWTGEGVGRPKGKGMAASWRGALYFNTSAPRLGQLNQAPVVFEYEVDEAGNTQSREWEWK